MHKMHRLTIRDMGGDDVPAVLEIEQASFSTPWSREFFLNELYKKDTLCKVAVSEESVIGYLCADFRQHESHILNLAVHPDFRRRGVATRLLHEAREELKKIGCAFMDLKVRVSNTGAQKFYERFGFKTESIRKKYYGNPDEDALQMTGRL
jgi:[ribosomal protein S18]-alanine N-acetyltransferase